MKSVIASILTGVVLILSFGVMIVVMLLAALLWVVAAFLIMLALVGLGIARAYAWGKALIR